MNPPSGNGSKTKVALWGSYAYGNYGDELMAICFAQYLNRAGARSTVYALEPVLAQQYKIEASPRVAEVIDGARFCVLGGGSLLSGGKPTRGAYAESKEREYLEFLSALENTGCPVYPISVGGDGEFTGTLKIADYRERLLRSGYCRGATVRQPNDVHLLNEHFGLTAEFYPDVVLGAPERFGIRRTRSEDGRMQVGLCLSHSDRWTGKFLEILATASSRSVLHYFSTVRVTEGPWHLDEFVPERTRRGIAFHRYCDPAILIRDLSQLDVMITNKLHIGMTALAMGIPYLCVAKSLKCKAFLSSIGAIDAYLGDLTRTKRLRRLVQLVTSPRSLARLSDVFDFAEIRRQTDASEQHFDYIRSVLHSHSN